MARTEPIIFYAASREWAVKNPDTIKKFRAAIAEAAPIVNNDREKASASIQKFSLRSILTLLDSYWSSTCVLGAT